MSNNQPETDQLLLTLAEKLLLSQDDVTQAMLAAYQAPGEPKPKTLGRICYVLCGSLKKKQKHEHVFQGTIGSLNKLNRVLLDFDPKKLVEKYQKGDWEKLFEAVKEEVMFQDEPSASQRNVIPQFCKGVLSAAYFFHQFENAKAFYEWVDTFKQDEETRLDLPTLLSQEVHGLGFALACDFLQELGYTGFGKPDANVKAMFKELDLLPQEEDTDEDAATFEIIGNMARNSGRTQYDVERLFGLLGSGYFFKHGMSVPSPKNEFILEAREVLGQPQS